MNVTSVAAFVATVGKCTAGHAAALACLGCKESRQRAKEEKE